jgi:hypothetical protein
MQVTAPSHSSNVTSANILPVVFEFFVHPKSIFRPCQTAINSPSYVSRVLRLTLLAPAIVQSILNAQETGGDDAGGADEAVSVAWTEPRKSNFCWKNALPLAARRTDDEGAVQSKSSIACASSPFLPWPICIRTR